MVISVVCVRVYPQVVSGARACSQCGEGEGEGEGEGAEACGREAQAQEQEVSPREIERDST